MDEVEIGMEERQWAQLIAEIDLDGDGKISMDEFTKALTGFISKTTKGIINQKTTAKQHDSSSDEDDYRHSLTAQKPDDSKIDSLIFKSQIKK